MKFQLVLQFDAEQVSEYDSLVPLEETLRERLSPRGDVDGHDFGRGEFNIFIFTDDPKHMFEAAHALIREQFPRRTIRAAYREIDSDEFVVLWPPNASDFVIA